MRFISIVFAALLLFAGSAAARTGFQGEAVITAVQGTACAENDERVGAIYYVAFMPRGVTDNGPDSFITFYSYKTAFSLRIANSPLDSGSPYTSVYINSYGKHLNAPNGTIVSASGAAAPTATTPFLNVRMQISNWSAVLGCTVSLEGSFIRRR
jgi:hypothetical protein